MAIPWASLKSLLIFFGPWLLPRAIGYYRRLKLEASRRRQQQQQQPADVRPLPLRGVLVLALLTGAAVMWLLSSGLVPNRLLTALSISVSLAPPENIFVATQSRLQAPTDVLFTRLAALRPGKTLTAADEALRARFASLESRLLYLQYGPDVLAGCPFCGGTGVDATGGHNGFSANAYFYYALVDLVAPHLVNLVLIAAATSPLLLLGRRGKGSAAARAASAAGFGMPGVDGGGGGGVTSSDDAYDASAAHIRGWRAPASIAALALAAFDVYAVATYERQANARATRLVELQPFFWTMRLYRGLASGCILGLLAVILYWAATGRHNTPALGLLGVLLFGATPPPSPVHRVAAVTRSLGAVKSKLNAGAIVKNTALRDADLRGRTQAYWAREVMLVAAAMEEREVLEGVNDALLNRIDMQRITQDAELYAQNVVPSAAPLRQPTPQPQPQQPPQSEQQRESTRSRASTPVAEGSLTKRK
ncbi:hypothetical protein SPI_01016 [Niveomyces insectorum RCEF 264]|uniref:Uncharacterized protein n=1 Tax=Niveomyces insectorum RCEF 264 TaxID=1081102 RepID=A0A162MSW2_9HYPO|nr:hypothetical protein SPI_01016 [Niveomyces insectorum RCEF 264]